jgi:similar to stage IV sporulation protein
VGGNCDKINHQRKWTLPGGSALPVTWERETLLPYETVLTRRSRDEAQSQGEAVLQEYLLAQIGADGSVKSARCASAVQGDWLLVTLSAECLEQIGQEVPIPVG